MGDRYIKMTMMIMMVVVVMVMIIEEEGERTKKEAHSGIYMFAHTVARIMSMSMMVMVVVVVAMQQEARQWSTLIKPYSDINHRRHWRCLPLPLQPPLAHKTMPNRLGNLV